MTPPQALPILRALADGVDPHTGEVFPAGSAYQHVDTVRALFVAIAALEASEGKPKPAKRADLPPQAGKPWTDEEDAHLREAFAVRTPAKSLAVSSRNFVRKIPSIDRKIPSLA